MLVIALIIVSPVWNVLVLARGWDAVAAQALPAFLGSFGLGMLVAVWAQWRQAGGRSCGQLGQRATAALVTAGATIVIGDATWHENDWWLRDGIFRESFLRPRVQLELVGHLATATGFALLIAARHTDPDRPYAG